MRDNVLRIIAGFNREGMTGAKDLNISQAKWDLYKQLLDEGKLNVRMFALWRGGATIESVQQAMASIDAAPKLPAVARRRPAVLGRREALHRRQRRRAHGVDVRRLEQGPDRHRHRQQGLSGQQRRTTRRSTSSR